MNVTEFKKLTITHNHGKCVLENGTIENGVAKGTCIGGGEQSSMMGHTLNRSYPIGVEKTYPVYSRQLHPVYESDWKTPVEGEFTVDVCTCG